MHDNVTVILTHDSSDKIVVEAGKNIISGITTEVVDRNLIIHNRNSCNWVRNYEKPINVYVSSKSLWKVWYESSGDLISKNTLSYDSIKIETWGGCGKIDLDLNIVSGYFIQNLGTSEFILSGVCGICSIYAGEYGPFLCQDLSTAYCFINHSGSNDCWVKVSTTLGATVNSIGNIYYTGNPDTLDITINGSGQVIRY